MKLPDWAAAACPWAKPPENREPAVHIFVGGNQTKVVELRGLTHLVLGRQGDIVIEDPSASRQHAAIVNSAGSTWLLDLKSAQGTFLGDERVAPVPRLGTEVPPGKPVALTDGQTIRLGASATVFQIRGVAEAEAEKWAIPAWCTLPTSAVTLLGGPKGNLRRDISSVRGVVIGRSEERSDVAVPDGSVSRQHAAIVSDEDTTYVVDLGSAHGTYVDGTRLAEGVYTKVSGEAKLAFGTAPYSYTLRVSAPRAAGGNAAKRQKA